MEYSPTPATQGGAPAPAGPPTADGRRTSCIRRSRPTYSCEACRARRVKCDRLRPKCSSCVRNNVDCVYRTNQKRKERHNEDVKKESPTKPAWRIAMEYNKPFTPGHLVMKHDGRSRYTENTPWACVDIEGLDLDALLFDLPLLPLESACCAACQGSTMHEASNSNYQHCGHASEYDFFWASRRSTSPEAQSHNLTLTLLGLPFRETCDRFYEDFVESVHPLIPLVHLPTFDRSYQRFWEWYETWQPGQKLEGIMAESPSFLPLLLTVLFTGSTVMSRRDGVRNMSTSQETQNRLYHLITSALVVVGFPCSPSLYSLVAFILLNSMIIREEESVSSCSFVAIAFRICQAMGLHKDGTDFGLDNIQVEERRRIWCHLMHLDVMTSIVSGLPLVGSSEMFSDTRMIREVRDEYLGEPRNEDVETEPPIDPDYILTAGRYDATSCIREILLRQFSPDTASFVCVKNLEESIEALHFRTERRIERLTTQFQQDGDNPLNSRFPKAPRNHGGNTNTHRVCWGKNLLRLMVEKAYCLLYQPIMRDSKLWNEIRPRAISRFQSFLSIFIDMSMSESYLQYQWLYPGAYEPLQPIAVLLVDLLNNPRSNESARSRSLLEKAFFMLGAGSRRVTNGSLPMKWSGQRYISRGAKQAWVGLEKLRSKVWQKLDLDDSFVWTSIAHSKSHSTLEDDYKNKRPMSGNT